MSKSLSIIVQAALTITRKLHSLLKNSVNLTENSIKLPVENVSKNYLLNQQKYSLENNRLLF